MTVALSRTRTVAARAPDVRMYDIAACRDIHCYLSQQRSIFALRRSTFDLNLGGQPIFRVKDIPARFARFQGSGSGFRVQVLGFRVQVSGSGSQIAGFRVQVSGFRVQESRFRVQVSGFRVQGAGFRVQSRRTPALTPPSPGGVPRM